MICRESALESGSKGPVGAVFEREKITSGRCHSCLSCKLHLEYHHPPLGTDARISQSAIETMPYLPSPRKADQHKDANTKDRLNKRSFSASKFKKDTSLFGTQILEIKRTSESRHSNPYIQAEQIIQLWSTKDQSTRLGEERNNTKSKGDYSTLKDCTGDRKHKGDDIPSAAGK